MQPKQTNPTPRSHTELLPALQPAHSARRMSSFPMPMKHYILFAASLFCCIQVCLARSRAANRAYVQSMDGSSPFYARCIPRDPEGNKGTTTIFRVHETGDEKVDTYDW